MLIGFGFFVDEHTNVPTKYLMDVISYFQSLLHGLHKRQQHNKQEVKPTQKTQKQQTCRHKTKSLLYTQECPKRSAQ